MRDFSFRFGAVHVRGLVRRGLRLEWMAGLGIALAVPALALAAGSERSVATQTTLTAETHDRSGGTEAAVTVAVAGEDGLPATGAVIVQEAGRQLASAALNAEGHASLSIHLPAGEHALRAIYLGDAAHQASTSQAARVHGMATTTPNFTLSLSPVPPGALPLVLKQGASGTVLVTLTPENNASLAAPMFITVSCSGLPDESSCTFTPETVEIQANTLASCAANSTNPLCPPTSSMVIETQLGTNAKAAPAARKGAGSVAWALLLPGSLALIGFAWGSRRRAWLSRMSLLMLVGLVSVLGTTACNERYNYFHHGPPGNPPTPPGTYTVQVTAQSTNGITAITHSTSMVLTVQ
jgi:Bacterial Ig-like domain (group 3)